MTAHPFQPSTRPAPRTWPTGPAPDGLGVELTIECTATAADRFGIPHQVAVRPDWSVETPHDLDVERIARSFGGWCSCLQFAEQVVPAFRSALEVMAEPGRFGTSDLGESIRREIRPEQRVRAAADPTDPADARVTAPVASAETIAAEHRLYDALFAQAGRVWAEHGDPRHLDDPVESYSRLWRAGVLPAQVEAIARLLPRETWPLPATFYERAHFAEVDATWLTNVVNCYPTREFAEWAVADRTRCRRHADEVVWRMYDLGLGDRDAMGALDAGVSIDALGDLAHRPGVGGTSAARWLTLWSTVGAAPTAAHYRLLEEHRVLLERPPLWKLDWTVGALRAFGPGAPSRTELAVMLALSPDVGLVEQAVQRGIRTANDRRFIRLVRKGKTK